MSTQKDRDDTAALLALISWTRRVLRALRQDRRGDPHVARVLRAILEALIRCPDGRDRCLECFGLWERLEMPAWRLGGVQTLETPLPATSGRMTP
ncbi:MAG: hypothetical protein HY717_03465 [Planctomycetes bacterium]|nr:hypothetical protein [Planctomycetota bacterium]